MSSAATESPPPRVLAIDIGGTKVKLLATGETEPRKVSSGPRMTPARMISAVAESAQGWDYEVISIGYPGLVGDHGPRSEPGNLAPGWVGFDYAAAFGKPVRIVNDASMQALGSYDGGRMLFLGLGTGVGSTLIAENVIVPLELGQLPLLAGRTLGEELGRAGLAKSGKKAWRAAVCSTVNTLSKTFLVDYIVLGGGNAKQFKEPPCGGVRLGNNLTAFRGGFRLWHIEDVQTQRADGKPPEPLPPPTQWRLI
ncbi:MAG TPA: ROK family protein [Pirellulales bacterium]|jgi:polyphosphate glucokinase|nr:ROK family protein [Pirellulales bacterium]